MDTNPVVLDRETTKTTAPDRPKTRRRLTILLNDIAARACEKWHSAGLPVGDGSRFWLEAEQELLRRSDACAD